MLKKAICLCIIVCVSFVSIIPIHAQERGSLISHNTVITEDNIYEVLEYLGIDASNFVRTDAKKASTIFTVKDLEKAIKEFDEQPSEFKEIKYFLGNETDFDGEKYASMRSSGTVMLYSTSDFDGFTLEYSVSGQYDDDCWTGSGGAWVDIDSPNIIIVRKIDSKNLNVTLHSNNTILRLTAEVEVGVYLGIGAGFIKIGSQDVYSIVNWGTDEIP
jgi:hypothetical protein